jgi:uncharacterized membrane protein
MSRFESSVDLEVPASAAYNQWTQFEEFPRFMEGVEEVRQLDDRRLQWRTELGGKTREWMADITEQIPDKRIAWRSTTGAHNAGVVTIHRLSDATSRIALQIDYEPEGLLETLGVWMDVVGRRVKGDLERFKELIESREVETGAWRGAIPSRDERV